MLDYQFVLIFALIALCFDWGQTRTIAKNPTKWSETNLILGRHPSLEKVNIYFALVSIIVSLIAWNTESLIFCGIVTLVEVYYVYHNYSLGIKPF